MASKAVTVCCRFRPRVAKADLASGADAFIYDEHSVQAKERGSSFTFDHVFGPSKDQSNIFEEAAKPLVEAALNGINATIMCYGQTGSGKTFTMTGVHGDEGVIPRVVECIFRRIEDAPDTTEFTIRMSYLEIYMERVRDLLNPDTNNLAIRQDAVRGIFVENAVEEYVASAEELLQLVRIGDSNRAVGTTGMNDISSRSHSVVMITLETRDTVTRSMKLSKLSLVDLAGSESVSRTGAEGITLDEARMINKSLFNLAKCINALAGVGESEAALAASLLGSPAGDGSSVAPAAKRVSHIPYRDSKLTRLLQDSLGGNARTALIVCCSPCTSNMTESLSTLRFGQRAKQMKNKPVVNRVRSVEELERLLAKAEIAIDAQSAFIKALQSQIADLSAALSGDAEALAMFNGGSPGSPRDVVEDRFSPLGAAAESHTRPNADEADDESWNDPNSWMTSPAARLPGGPEAPVVVFRSGPGSVTGSRRGSLTGNNAADGSAMANLLELSNLREEISIMSRQRVLDTEELENRAEEIQNLSRMLKAREEECEKLKEDVSLAHTSGISEGVRQAMVANVNTLQAFACRRCDKHPFADLIDVAGVAVVHEQMCFEGQESAAALARVEQRAALLQEEVDSLKTFISQSAVPDSKPAAALSPQRPAEGAAAISEDPRSVKREVVEVVAMQDLQGKLTALIHVHRQLLRKYAVVDVECGELAESLKARDDRIGELSRAALAHSAALKGLRDTYESRVLEIKRENASQMLSMRKELVVTRGQGMRHVNASNSAPGSARKRSGGADESKMDGENFSDAGSAAGLTFEEGVARSEADALSDDASSGGIVATRNRHVIKPIRGHNPRSAGPTTAIPAVLEETHESDDGVSPAPRQSASAAARIDAMFRSELL